MFFDFSDLRGNVSREARLFAGHPLARDIVNETLCRLGDEFHALGRSRGSNETDREKTVGFHQLRIARGFVGRQVENQEAVRSSGGGIRMEPVESVNVNGIQIGEENDGNLGASANLTHGIQHTRDRSSGIQRTTRGGLNGRSIRQRIRKGNAQLDNIHPRLLESRNKGRGGFQIGIPRRDVGDEATLSGGAEGFKFRVDAVGRCHVMGAFSEPRVIHTPSRAISAGVTPLRRAA